MRTRSELRALISELRHANTRLLPMEVAERVQHLIVRIEELIVSPAINPDTADELYDAARAVMGYCDTLAGKP